MTVRELTDALQRLPPEQQDMVVIVGAYCDDYGPVESVEVDRVEWERLGNYINAVRLRA